MDSNKFQSNYYPPLFCFHSLLVNLSPLISNGSSSVSGRSSEFARKRCNHVVSESQNESSQPAAYYVDMYTHFLSTAHCHVCCKAQRLRGRESRARRFWLQPACHVSNSSNWSCDCSRTLPCSAQHNQLSWRRGCIKRLHLFCFAYIIVHSATCGAGTSDQINRNHE